MADNVDKQLSETVKELRETNRRVATASSELAKVGGGLATFGSSIGKEIVENSGLKAFANLPFANLFGSLGSAAFQKFKQRREDKLLAKQLGVSKEAIKIQRRQHELAKAEEARLEALKKSAESLGLNADKIKEVNEKGIAVLTGSFRDEMGRFTTEATASLESRESNLGMSEASEAAAEKRAADTRQETLFERIAGGIEGIADKDFGGEDDESKGIFGGIFEKIKALGPLLLGGLTTLGSTIVAAVTMAGRLGRATFRGLRRGLTRAVTGLPKAMGKLPAFASKAVGAVARAGSSVASMASKGASLAGAGLKSAIGAAKVAAKVAGPIGLAVTAGLAIFDGFSAGIEEYKKTGDIGSAVKEGFAGAVSGLTFGLISQETVSEGLTSIGNFFSDTIDGAVSLAKNAYDALPSMDEITTGITNTATALNSKFEEYTGINISESVSNGITALKTSVSETASALKNKFEEMTGLTVPTDFASTKQFILDGATKLNDKFAELTGIDIGETFTGLKDSIVNGATALGNKFTEITGIEIPTDFAGVKTLITDGAAALGTKFTELTGIDIGETFTGIKDKISSVATNLSNKFTELTGIEVPSFDDVKTGLTDLGTSIKDRFSGITESVGGWFSNLFSGDDEPEGRAIGGRMAKGQPYLVGERGPELVVPEQSSYVMTANRTNGLLAAGAENASFGRMGGGTAPVVVNNAPTTVNNSSSRGYIPIPINDRSTELWNGTTF